jgi:hypothetical protein
LGKRVFQQPGQQQNNHKKRGLNFIIFCWSDEQNKTEFRSNKHRNSKRHQKFFRKQNQQNHHLFAVHSQHTKRDVFDDVAEPENFFRKFLLKKRKRRPYHQPLLRIVHHINFHDPGATLHPKLGIAEQVPEIHFE